MSRLTDHDLHLRTNGHERPIANWPLQAVRTRGHRDLIDRLATAALVLGFGLIALVAVAGVLFAAYLAARLVGELFGGHR